MKIKPNFEGAFLIIMKLEKTQCLWANNDVIDKKVTRTMYRKVNSLNELREISSALKNAATDDLKLNMSTTFAIVSCFKQDEKGQIIGVEKYGLYGLQEWKIEPKK